MRVLVTGGSGRLGNSVLDELADAGNETVCVDTAFPKDTSRHRFFPADFADPGECYSTIAHFRPEAIVHLAAIPAPFMRSEIETFRTNTALAHNVCQAALDLGVGSVLVASSPTVMGYGNPGGWCPEYLPLDEEHPVAPWNSYTFSKTTAEQLVRGFATLGRGAFHAFRPCFVVAPEDWRGAPTQDGGTVHRRLENPELAAGSLFNYVDARDAAVFVRMLLEQSERIPNGENFFVAGPDALAREPLSELLPRYTPVPAELASGLTGTEPAFDHGKARRLLGWSPRYSWHTELS
ncbi:NAD-dependent epimerase/dehydratase family protein [Actinopolyspora sp. H202]|uniref:NAD-dependent epimerase/dehydratase family protein n=1 Tax=Actinopolyspora sp. H202 TaxID=1500456 RepID=UPI003EE5F4FB